MYTPPAIRKSGSFAVMKETNLLVSGASGNSGSLIIKAVARLGRPVRALVRDVDRASFLHHLPGVTTVQGDMLQKESVLASLDGIERVVLISSANHRMVETQCSFIDACKEAGVRHVIKFSGEESQEGYDADRFRYTREHNQIEDYLESSGLAWTHLRPSQFMQVYLRELPGIRQTGALRLPLEQISMSPVDLQDVAEAAARLLTEGGHEGESLRMTGPEALPLAQIAAILGRVMGRPVRYEAVSWAERRQQLEKAGLPDFFLDALADQAAERVRHPQAIVDLGTHQLFGIIPTSFEQFAQRHAAELNKIE